MSYQEKVIPGKVNNLISFFENQTDDTTKTAHYCKESFSSSNGNEKQEIVENYFSENTIDCKQMKNGSITVENVEVFDNTYRESLQTVRDSVFCADEPQNQTVFSADEPQNQTVFSAEPQNQTVFSADEPQTQTAFEEISYKEELRSQKRSSITSSTSSHSEQDSIEKEKIQIDYNRPTCQSNDNNDGGCVSSECEKAVEDKLYKLKVRESEKEGENIIYLGDDLDESYYAQYQNIEVVKHSDETQEGYTYEKESISSEGEVEGKPQQEIGFVQPEPIETLQQDEQTYTIPYELLPSHLKGFTSPTVFPAPYYEPDEDATRLKKAMKGLGTDEATIIDILTSRSVEQRLEISYSYENLFQKSLVHELKKELSGNFENVIVSLMTSPYELLATELRRAVKGVGTDEDTLIEILCVYDDQDIIRIKSAYERLFRNSLKDDIYEDTSGDFRKILLSILAACREDPNAAPSLVAAQLCETDAKGKSTLDLDTLRTVLVSYTRPFLYSVFAEYEELAGKTFGDLIKATTSSGETRNALLALYQGILSVAVFFGKELDAAFKGLGAKDSKLIRIIVSRAEFDLADIKDAFYELYHKNLEKEVQKETSGDYKKVLVALIIGNNTETESIECSEKL